MAASSPSNYLAFNAEAQQKAHRHAGREHRQGHARTCCTTCGRATCQHDRRKRLRGRPQRRHHRRRGGVRERAVPAARIQAAHAPRCYERPFLLVPPCINKFYILDLQPENSLIRYAVEQGHRMFVVSWRNPDESMRTRPPGTTTSRTPPSRRSTSCRRSPAGRRQINTLGFCVGGTILGTALAVLAARGEQPAASVTLLTTLLDFSRHRRAGHLHRRDVREVPRNAAATARAACCQGRDLASTFSFLRPNDLVWNYVVGNYLKGETPPPFDLLYWNSDATNLPGPFYAWYLRNTYLREQPRASRRQLDRVRREDRPRQHRGAGLHLRLARGPHRAHRRRLRLARSCCTGKKRFVMGASGHIAGVINPPAKKKRSHWIRADGKLPSDAGRMAAPAPPSIPAAGGPTGPTGSSRHAGKQIAAPKAYGKGQRLQGRSSRAPGRYVKAQSLTAQSDHLDFTSTQRRTSMEDIVIVSAARTAVGKFGGSLAKHPRHRTGCAS